MFVDSADRLDWNDAEVVGPEPSLAAPHLVAAEEPGKDQYVFSRYPGRLSIQVVAEQVAVEVLAQPLEELVERVRGLVGREGGDSAKGRWPVMPTSRTLFVDDLPVEEVAGKDYPAEEGVKNRVSQPSPANLNQPLSRVLQVGEQFPIDATAGSKDAG